MKNKEKFAKEIVELACDGSDIAVFKATGNPIACNNTQCSDCMLYKDTNYTCHGALREWAESEYIEKTVISKMDRAFLEYLKGYKYIAIDYGGKLCAYVSIPKKIYDGWGYASFKSLAKLDIDFPMVKWSDSEPWLIEDLKKLEVVEEYE